MSSRTTIVWFRKDLRLADNPALHAAAQRGPIVPVFIWAPEEEADWAPGEASRWWLNQSLGALEDQLRTLGSRLMLCRGSSQAVLQSLVRASGAEAVYWNRRYEPAVIERDKKIKQGLTAAGIEAKSFSGSVLFEPWTVENKTGGPFRVFTPFWKACLAQGSPSLPLPIPASLQQPAVWPDSIDRASLELDSGIDSARGLSAAWRPGSLEAENGLGRFAATALSSYAEDRDRLDGEALSRLSAHLHFGEISPRQIWERVEKTYLERGDSAAKGDAYLRQLGWREFAYHQLYHFPHTTDQPLRSEFESFAWEHDDESLRAWQRGETGVPIIDAAMRHLSYEGWLPNRVRMVVASYLTKNLLISWREGAAWFWDKLIDADLANNTFGWQWTAGCGADAAPYFRIFNPVIQSAKFDPQGEYIHRWIPALRQVPMPWLGKPWDAPHAILKQAGVCLGKTYPVPLIDLAFSRQRALASYAKMRQ